MKDAPAGTRCENDSEPRRVHALERERLAVEMEVGYRAEAEAPSLDLEWASFEVEGLCGGEKRPPTLKATRIQTEADDRSAPPSDPKSLRGILERPGQRKR